jgi:hypothetical protein
MDQNGMMINILVQPMRTALQQHCKQPVTCHVDTFLMFFLQLDRASRNIPEDCHG